MELCGKVYKNKIRSVKYNGKFYNADGTGIERVSRAMPLKYFILAAIICAFAVPLVVMLELRTDPNLAEWWTRNIQAGWEKAIGTLTSWVPFSVLELLIICLIGAGLFLFARFFVNLCKARFSRILLGVLALGVGAMYVLDMYVMTMGFGYYRAAMPLPQSGEKYGKAETAEVVEYFYADYNELANTLARDENGCVICPYTFSELADKLADEYKRLDDGYFNSYTPKAKPVVNSWFMSHMLITGITFLPTGEANVNNAAPPTVRTVTMAHELAHAKGVMREGDANLLARYILVSSDDSYLRYCGYYAAFDNLLSALTLTGDMSRYAKLGSGLSPYIEKERRYAYEYWQSQPDIIGKIAEFFNNLYLKSNGAQNGTGSYNDGNKSDVVIPIDPGTGEPAKNPDTGEIVRDITYSQVQKMFFALYENIA